ncbi:LOW QUALITY PROTEIN: uncharacterized protein LOC127840451 [Dreissena polymorpha]|uniref:LOW QUALITY PROTEIN: uncharacterized protein LOC127840451 n=1 Tax=Dreissena polymorpha TaxID=45954 RepID=UPI002263D402|nr:LOW QUALITY PROTEIN: uncharacterized protein LOC127840451 [Dreissena polymorpha]
MLAIAVYIGRQAKSSPLLCISARLNVRHCCIYRPGSMFAIAVYIDQAQCSPLLFYRPGSMFAIAVYIGQPLQLDPSHYIWIPATTIGYQPLQLDPDDAGAFHFNYSGGIHGDWTVKHSQKNQLKRRAHMARARNDILSLGMKKGHFDQVLWIDSDVKYFPSDLIHQLLYARADVVVPSCLYKDGRFKKVYDRNTTSTKYQSTLPEDMLIVEGYRKTSRLFLPDLKAEGKVVPLDGVGGSCVLMVKAECHRKGLIFPEKMYNHHIETEGLSKMATNIGFSVRGLPCGSFSQLGKACKSARTSMCLITRITM